MDTVESVCNGLARYKVLDADLVRTLRTRWREQTGDRAELVDEFKRWLVRTGRVTDFQMNLLSRGHGEHLFLEDYKLLDRIGKGRNSGVYRAVHSAWGQVVAIKVLPPSRAKNPVVLSRFLREARLAFRLDHDNIVRTFHFGHTNENLYYIVMEYLDGETVDEMLKRRKNLPVPEAVNLMIQAMQGVTHMDEKGLIHRDLKPSNMILVPSEVGDLRSEVGDQISDLRPPTSDFRPVTLKILDIGLSRALFDEGDPSSGEMVDLTREGALLGSVNYMAPEQARDPHSADIRADIYSMGCVFYELLTGQPPFADNNLARQIRRHAQEKPRPLAQVTPGIPDPIDGIVQKMLAKDPAMRYLTPGQVIKDLRDFLSRDAQSGSESMPSGRPARPLKTFVTWLETKRAEPQDDPPMPPTMLVPEPPAATAPVRIASSPTGTLLEPSPEWQAPAVDSSAGPPIAASAAQVATIAPPVAAPAREQTLKGLAGELVTSILRLLKQTVFSLGRLTWRDWICIASGAVALLAVQAVWRLIRG